MIIRIHDLRLRAILGVDELERRDRQDVIVNIEMEVDGARPAASDDIADAVNYRNVTKRVAEAVEASRVHLLERLVHQLLELVMAERGVRRASVRVEKPHALRFADSVSVEESAAR